jgi:hypothetical protein
VFPNFVILQEKKYMFKNISRKQKAIDEQQKNTGDSQKKSCLGLNDNSEEEEKIFNSAMMKEINLNNHENSVNCSKNGFDTQLQAYINTQNTMAKSNKPKDAEKSNLLELNLPELVDKFILKDSQSLIDVNLMLRDSDKLMSFKLVDANSEQPNPGANKDIKTEIIAVKLVEEKKVTKTDEHKVNKLKTETSKRTQSQDKKAIHIKDQVQINTPDKRFQNIPRTRPQTTTMANSKIALSNSAAKRLPAKKPLQGKPNMEKKPEMRSRSQGGEVKHKQNAESETKRGGPRISSSSKPQKSKGEGWEAIPANCSVKKINFEVAPLKRAFFSQRGATPTAKKSSRNDQMKKKDGSSVKLSSGTEKSSDISKDKVQQIIGNLGKGTPEITIRDKVGKTGALIHLPFSSKLATPTKGHILSQTPSLMRPSSSSDVFKIAEKPCKNLIKEKKGAVLGNNIEKINKSLKSQINSKVAHNTEFGSSERRFKSDYLNHLNTKIDPRSKKGPIDKAKHHENAAYSPVKNSRKSGTIEIKLKDQKEIPKKIPVTIKKVGQ